MQKYTSPVRIYKYPFELVMKVSRNLIIFYLRNFPRSKLYTISSYTYGSRKSEKSIIVGTYFSCVHILWSFSRKVWMKFKAKILFSRQPNCTKKLKVSVWTSLSRIFMIFIKILWFYEACSCWVCIKSKEKPVKRKSDPKFSFSVSEKTNADYCKILGKL